TPRTRRARERPAQDLEDPPETPLLPLENRAARQGHPRIADPRGITKMEKVQWLLRTVLAGLSQRHAIFVADLAAAVRSPPPFSRPTPPRRSGPTTNSLPTAARSARPPRSYRAPVRHRP